jgi:hypothetical protein
MDAGPGILWTAMPLELVTEGLFPQAQNCVEHWADGRLLLVTPGEGGIATVQRLISGDAQDYLDPRWQPGAQVMLTRG